MQSIQEVLDDLGPFEDASWRADLESVVASTAAAAREWARDAVTLAALAVRVPRPGGPGARSLPWQSFVREIAVARRVQDTAAAMEIEHAERLITCHPQTLKQLADGKITVNRARALIDELVHVDAAVAAEIDLELAERAVQLTPVRIRQEVRRAIDRRDADAAADRVSRATAGRGVRRTPLENGQAEAVVFGPALPLTRWFTALTDAARARQAAGDPRGLDALRFDLVVAGFTHPDDAPQFASCSAEPPAFPSLAEAITRAGARPVEEPLSYCSENASGGQPDWLEGARSAAAPSPIPAASPVDDPPADLADPAKASADPADLAKAPADSADQPSANRAARLAAELVCAQAMLAAARADLVALQVTQAAALAAADRLTARQLSEALREGLGAPTDRRQSRPVQVLVHVPVTTALGLSQEPGWLEGYGWISAPQCRQLLPDAELRQVCVSASGQVIDLAPRAVRPAPTALGARAALLKMATQPFAVTEASWRVEAAHDPSDAVADLVRMRDRFCDAPTGRVQAAADCDLDHDQAFPDGPTAAWNLTARGRRTHRLKHYGWHPHRDADGTLWFSPAGQLVRVPHHRQLPPGLASGAHLPHPQEIHDLEVEQLREPSRDDCPPQLAPF